MNEMTVRHQGGDRFEIDVRGHRVIVDQPIGAGGSDVGPTPTELFVAGLASCVAFYAGRFLRRHSQPVGGLEVWCDFAMDPRAARVASVQLQVVVPAFLNERLRRALLAVVDHCTVHNSIRQDPEVGIRTQIHSLAA
ncbi:MAG: OsmC family protein [Actinomycetota bacterium]